MNKKIGPVQHRVSWFIALLNNFPRILIFSVLKPKFLTFYHKNQCLWRSLEWSNLYSTRRKNSLRCNPGIYYIQPCTNENFYLSIWKTLCVPGRYVHQSESVLLSSGSSGARSESGRRSLAWCCMYTIHVPL